MPCTQIHQSACCAQGRIQVCCSVMPPHAPASHFILLLQRGSPAPMAHHLPQQVSILCTDTSARAARGSTCARPAGTSCRQALCRTMADTTGSTTTPGTTSCNAGISARRRVQLSCPCGVLPQDPVLGEWTHHANLINRWLSTSNSPHGSEPCRAQRHNTQHAAGAPGVSPWGMAANAGGSASRALARMHARHGIAPP